MIHPHTKLQFINPVKGFGVVATQFIPKGTITWIYDELDITFTEDQFNNFTGLYRKTLDTYCYRNFDGTYIYCWDIAKYVNHSFVSNCISTAYNFELAVRDIQIGEELTDDYGYLNVTEPLDYPSEEGSSRKLVLPDDLPNFHKEWDAKLNEAFKHFNQVDQPLKSLIASQYQEKIEAIAGGTVKMDSILNCYYNPERT